jgi:hypothetical protein
MTKKLLLALLLCSSAYAADGEMHLLAKNANVPDPTTQRVEHSRLLPNGDIHSDVVVSGNGVYADFHGPYPFDATGPSQQFIINFETDENDTNKQFCLLISACAQVDSVDFADCPNGDGVHFVFTAPSSGNSFVRRFITTVSDPKNVRRSAYNDFCTDGLGVCADSIVRYRVINQVEIDECTNPSGHELRIQDLIVRYQR